MRDTAVIRTRIVTGATAAMIVACGLAFQVSSASADVCNDLRAQLKAAQRADSGKSGRYRRYEDAGKRQKAELAKTLRIRRQTNCAAGPARCDSLDALIARMQGNIADIERVLRRERSGSNAARVGQIRARIRNSGCNGSQPIVRSIITPVPAEPGQLLKERNRQTRVIVREGVGRRQVRRDPDRQDLGTGRTIIVPQSGPSLGGTFRTLCVRTCDGYYFPISFSTTSDFFERDQQACSNMCPASESHLYYYRVPDQQSEDMVSLSGEPYSALPTAFLYRKQGVNQSNQACTCGRPREASADPDIIQPDMAVPPSGSANSSIVPVPGPKPDLLADPESQANAATGLAPDKIRELTGTMKVGDVRDPDGERKVRVVGPQFLPDPGEAIDLRSQAPKTDP